MEDVVADCSAETLVLGSELVQQASVEGRAFAGIGGVGVGECADFFIGRILEPDVFPEFLEVGVGGDVELCDDREEGAFVLPVGGLVACADERLKSEDLHITNDIRNICNLSFA